MKKIYELDWTDAVAKGATVKSRTTTYGNLWMREILFPKKGAIKTGHQHKFDHLHFLAKGSGIITIFDMEDDKKILLEKEFHAPCLLKVPKEHKHQMVSLEDDTHGFCIQAMHGSRGEIEETDFINDVDFNEEVLEYKNKVK